MFFYLVISYGPNCKFFQDPQNHINGNALTAAKLNLRRFVICHKSKRRKYTLLRF